MALVAVSIGDDHEMWWLDLGKQMLQGQPETLVHTGLPCCGTRGAGRHGDSAHGMQQNWGPPKLCKEKGR